MYVEEVCIDGFKSYAQRTVVPAFDPLFNAITGLNGSGKSNILDAICFVLGITNLSQVRPRLGLSDEDAPKRTKTVLFPFPKFASFPDCATDRDVRFFCFFCSVVADAQPETSIRTPRARISRRSRVSHVNNNDYTRFARPLCRSLCTSKARRA